MHGSRLGPCPPHVLDPSRPSPQSLCGPAWARVRPGNKAGSGNKAASGTGWGLGIRWGLGRKWARLLPGSKVGSGNKAGPPINIFIYTVHIYIYIYIYVFIIHLLAIILSTGPPIIYTGPQSDWGVHLLIYLYTYIYILYLLAILYWLFPPDSSSTEAVFRIVGRYGRCTAHVPSDTLRTWKWSPTPNY